MATQVNAILHLFQQHPYPLSFTDKECLMTDLITQIFAISSGPDCPSLKMSAVNLIWCPHISSVYLCKQHRVLKQDLNSTCLGYLYIQDFQGPTSLCKMEILPQVEKVLHQQDNWYLVYSLWFFTCFVICLHDSSSKTFIQHGAKRIIASPFCRLQLREHVLI